MKILITGNLGYVGPAVTSHFSARFPHAEIVGYDTGLFAHCLTGQSHVPEVILDRQIYGDIRDIPAEAFVGVDAVVHLAAVSNDPIGGRFEAVTDDINHVATVEAARRAHAAGVRNFVFASSCSVYGAAPGPARVESDLLNPQTAYARSKVSAEEGLLSEPLPGMTITCLRFATACGWSPRLRLDLVLNDFVASAISTGSVAILSDGSPWRPLIDVRDMARALEWGATRSAADGGDKLVVNAGHPDANYQVRDLAKAVVDALPGTTLSINTAAQPDTRSYQVDFSAFARLAPGFLPKFSLQESIEGLISGLNGMKFASSDFRNSEYMRLKVLEKHLTSSLIGSDLRWTARQGAAA